MEERYHGTWSPSMVAGNLEETFHRHATEGRPLVLLKHCMYSLCYELNGPGIESR